MTCYGDDVHEEEFMAARAEAKERAVVKDTAVSLLSTLTPRQLETAKALALGLSCREISEVLKISIKTVDTHRGAVLRKLGLDNTVQLARLAIAAGVVPAP